MQGQATLVLFVDVSYLLNIFDISTFSNLI